MAHYRAAFRCDLMPAQVAAAVFLLLWPICFVLAGMLPRLRVAPPGPLAANFRILDSMENRLVAVPDAVCAPWPRPNPQCCKRCSGRMHCVCFGQCEVCVSLWSEMCLSEGS